MKCFLLPSAAVVLAFPVSVHADAFYQPLPFSQDWSNTGLIVNNDDWSTVPGILGFLGNSDPGSPNDVDPRTLTANIPVSLDVNANRNDPDTFIQGGVAEFDGIANPVVALQGSGTADAPHLTLHFDTVGLCNILLSYVLRDIDGSADNAVQQANAQFRVGGVGPWTNIDGTYLADVTQGPNQAGQGFVIQALLPPAADNHQIQVRIMTTNASGSDEWIGIDDIEVRVQPPLHIDYAIVGCDLSFVGPDSLTFTLQFQADMSPDPLPGDEQEVPVRVLFN